MTHSARLTHNQEIVFDVLNQHGVPMTAYEILDTDMARRNGLKAPLTIYRALSSLVEKALVHRIESLNAFIACDHGPHLEPAAFLICRNCKKTSEITMGACKADFQTAAGQNRFSIEQVNIEMTGLCAACSGQEDH